MSGPRVVLIAVLNALTPTAAPLALLPNPRTLLLALGNPLFSLVTSFQAPSFGAQLLELLKTLLPQLEEQWGL